MDSQLLRAFLSVAHHRSFSKAGDDLCLTQSAVSKRIHLLEQHLNTSLFERHNRSISLTSAGQLLLPRAIHILDLMTDTEQEISNADQHVQGSLTIATSHHIGLHRLPPFLREFVKRYPEASVNLEFMGSERAYQAIAQREVELALTTLDVEQTGQCHSQLLWTDTLVCVCGTDHQLTQERSLTLAALSKTPAILPGNDTITYRLVAAAFQQQGLKLKTPMPTNYLETIKMMVSVGLGWSMLPENMLDSQVHTLPWPLPRLERHLGLIRLPERTLSNAGQAFLDLITQPEIR